MDHDTTTNSRIDTTTNAGGSTRHVCDRTKRLRMSPHAVARSRTVVLRFHYEPALEFSLHPYMSTTTHEYEYNNSVNNNTTTSLNVVVPTGDHNNATIVELSTIEFDVSGCGS